MSKRLLFIDGIVNIFGLFGFGFIDGHLLSDDLGRELLLRVIITIREGHLQYFQNLGRVLFRNS